MIGTRYEDYCHSDNMLPFIMNTDLLRTQSSLSREQNWHEELEIQLCHEGSGSVLLNGERLDFNEGDIITVAPNVIHYTGTKTRIVYSCIIINCDFIRKMGIDCNTVSFSPRINSEYVRKLFCQLKALYDDTETPWRTVKLNLLLLSLITELAEHHSSPKNPPKLSNRAFDSVRKTINYIRQNYQARIRLDALSLFICTDKYTLCRDFKRLTGQTIIEYTNSYRCQRAAELISSGATVAEAASACGFENMSFFTRCFKKNTGNLPSSYKE